MTQLGARAARYMLAGVVWVSSSTALAQVDWSEMFAEEAPAAPKPQPVAPPPAVRPAPAPAPVAAPAAAPAAPRPVAEPVAPRPAPVAKPVAPPPPPPVAKPAVPPPPEPLVKAPAPPPPAAQPPPPPPVAKPVAPAAPPPPVAEVEAPPPVVEAPAAPPPVAAAPAVERATSAPLLSELGLREGDVIDAQNGSQYTSLLTPGMQWAVGRGWRLKLVEAKSIRAPRAYLEATERYAAQVRLGAGGLSLENYVAGRPFPQIDTSDPDAVKKIMWNYYYNFNVIDDVVYRNFEPRTGTIADDGHLQVERAYVVDGYRKLNYNGRLYVDPKPELPNPEGVRFKEAVHPILQPYDLKGVGFLAYRYHDPGKQDDSWLYLPQLRRVRRMSTAQRSDALFGQDTDADAFGGYNGHIAWMDFHLLGEQVVLMPMHTTHCPAKWQDPEDWAFEDVWEPRKVWVVEARSKFPQYAYSKRVLYIDREAYVIPLSDSYDRAGQLWKVQANMFAQKREAGPGSTLARYDEDMLFQHATVIADAQLLHATSTAIPSLGKTADTYLLNRGQVSGATDDKFTVAYLVAAGR
jgi:hypothetical protein